MLRDKGCILLALLHPLTHCISNILTFCILFSQHSRTEHTLKHSAGDDGDATVSSSINHFTIQLLSGHAPWKSAEGRVSSIQSVAVVVVAVLMQQYEDKK